MNLIFLNRKGDVVESLRIMVAELEPVVLWLSNALEMLHYLQCHLNRYLGPKTQTSSAMKESLASADEDSKHMCLSTIINHYPSKMQSGE